jgi:4-diphosphocytidyl-2-C-methyl-D-erythritol kinase
MELKAHCKINLGLRVLRRRHDGFHDIETVMMPVRGLHDTVSVEALTTPATYVPLTPPPYPAPPPVFSIASMLEVSGTVALDDVPPEQNICMRALRLLQREYGIGEALIRLHKQVPTGAGLGGGSADGAAVLRAADREFALELSDEELQRLAARLGSDVPFFTGDRSLLCEGRGEMMSPVEVDLAGLWLVIVKPTVKVSTARAYADVTPREDGPSVAGILLRPVGEWRHELRNDFEDSIFALHPELGELKLALYEVGALYAQMSGSGSAMYGLFDRRPDGLRERLGQPFYHSELIR